MRHVAVKPTQKKQGGTFSDSRIDWVLSNDAALAAFVSYELLDDTGIPTHKPILVRFNWAQLAQNIPAWQRPLKIPLEVEGATADSDRAIMQEVFRRSEED